jgi:hypothetical protein
MTWHVQYKGGGSESFLGFPSAECAVEAACLLIDDGLQVLGIATDDPDATIADDEIARISAIWAREKEHFG